MRIRMLVVTVATALAPRVTPRNVPATTDASARAPSVRAVLLHVIADAREHAAQQGRTLAARWVDPCSSARQLDVWTLRVRLEPGIVELPHTWKLLCQGSCSVPAAA